MSTEGDICIRCNKESWYRLKYITAFCEDVNLCLAGTKDDEGIDLCGGCMEKLQRVVADFLSSKEPQL